MTPELQSAVDALLIAHLPPALHRRVRGLVRGGWTAREVVAFYRPVVARVAARTAPDPAIAQVGRLTLAAIEAVAMAEAERMGRRGGSA